MAATKTFTTQFLIGSKFTGQKGFDQANRQLTRTQKTAQVVSRGLGTAAIGFGKLAGAIGVATIAYKALGKAMEFWGEGVKASEDAVKVQEALGVAAQRNAKRYKMSGAAIEKSLTAVSEKVAAVGFDSEDAMAGTTKLLESMSPKQIEGFGQAFTDITAKLKGATPGAEGFADVAAQINQAVLRGKAPWLAQIGATDAQLKAFKKLAPEQRLAYIQQIAQNRLQGEAERVFGTTAGKVAKAAKAYEDLGQTLTGPVVAKQGEMADAQLRLYTALQPVAELLASKMVPALENLAKWTADNQDKITAWGKAVVEWAGWAVDSFMWLQQKSENFFKPIADNTIREWNNIKAGAQAAWDGMVAIWDAAAGYFTSIVEAIGKAFIPLYNLIIKPFVDAYNYVAGLFPNKEPAKETPAYSGGARQESDYVPPWQQTGPPTAPAATGESEARTNQPGGSLPFPYTPAAASAQAATERAEPMTGKGFTPAHFASVRHHNPGAQYPGSSSRMFGGVDRTLGSGHKIASFPTPVHGAASNMQLLASSKHYAGKTVGEAMRTWSGGSRGVTGPGGKQFPPNMRITKEMTQDPEFMIPFIKAISTGESPGKYPMSEEQWKQAYDWYQKGGPQGKALAFGEDATAAANKAPLAQGPLANPAATPSLKDMIKPINLNTGAGGAQNVSATNNITVNGVAPGREALMAKKTALALRDPTAQLLTEIKRARSQESRLGYV